MYILRAELNRYAVVQHRILIVLRLGNHMSVAKTLTRLRDLALALPRPGCAWEERPRFDPPATSQSVADLERVAGFRLPDDFRVFLGETASVVGMSVHNGYWLGGVEQLIKGSGLPRTVKGENAIPVSTDGCGNAFLLAAGGGIWRWDHETDRVEEVAESFGAFLERVAEDWDAYISAKPGWRFLV
jgi:hypothetical protein